MWYYVFDLTDMANLFEAMHGGAHITGCWVMFLSQTMWYHKVDKIGMLAGIVSE